MSSGLEVGSEQREIDLPGQAVTWLLPHTIYYAVPPSQRWKPITQLFAEPYVVPEEEDREESENLTQAEWWELLFFIRQLSEAERLHIVDLLQDHLEEEVGTPQKCPPQVCIGTFGRSGGEARRSDSFRGPPRRDLECSEMQGSVGCQPQEVQNG